MLWDLVLYADDVRQLLDTDHQREDTIRQREGTILQLEDTVRQLQQSVAAADEQRHGHGNSSPAVAE